MPQTVDLDALLPRTGADSAPLTVAVIDEAHCIGCTLCIAACPVDAIAGANKRMHTVLPALCIGCSSCLPPCPVDCIVMQPAGRDWTPADESAARRRHRLQQERLSRAAPRSSQTDSQPDSHPDKQAAIAAALAKARARRLHCGA